MQAYNLRNFVCLNCFHHVKRDRAASRIFNDGILLLIEVMETSGVHTLVTSPRHVNKIQCKIVLQDDSGHMQEQFITAEGIRDPIVSRKVIKKEKALKKNYYKKRLRNVNFVFYLCLSI